MQNDRIAFLGAGVIAHAHIYAIAALPHYYEKDFNIERVVVSSGSSESRKQFASRYRFEEAVDSNDLWGREDINTVFILGPNDVHYQHLSSAIGMPGIRRIYVEKPICSTAEEESAIKKLIPNIPSGVSIQSGFQFLQMTTVRRALQMWNTCDLGTPIHFHARYLHSGYLDRDYRQKRKPRLKPAPVGGAIGDLGSHVLSLLIAFLGKNLQVVGARKSGRFEDVIPESDLCTTVLLQDQENGAAGYATASRISAGAGEVFELEIRCTKSALRLSTRYPDILEVYRMDTKPSGWQTIHCGSDYLPLSKFPALSCDSGWLRSLVHAHYLFFDGQDEHAFVPGIDHALEVQRLLRDTVQHLATG